MLSIAMPLLPVLLDMGLESHGLQVIYIFLGHLGAKSNGADIVLPSSHITRLNCIRNLEQLE